MERKEQTIELIKKYLSNQCNPDEIDELFTEITKPENESLVEKSMLETWYTEEGLPEIDRSNQDQLFNNINRDKAAHLRVSKNREHRIVSRWWGAAAIFLISIIGSWLFFESSPEAVDEVPLAEVVAGIGERKHLTLPDGSEVWLNSGTKIIYPHDFEERKVKLIGEAFFDVERDESRPFIVESEAIKTKVLGTSFNVRAYDEDNGVQVTVKTGKVGVGKSNNEFASITPNQQISYDDQNQGFSFQEVDASSLSSWKDGNLVFENVTFAEAVTTLKMQYGKDFKFENPALSKCRFTSKFDINEDLPHVLEVLTTLNGIDYRTEGNTIYFSGIRCL
ncbi:FecR family protein [Echinicola salinicaeni]|uniref:FecR family protein n=1 Tax=Echinicola salinicaeni TaxID=2762757 RepID=UPI001648CF94|nr:FecR domain-containing protein [Echinicola salinicaeni]